MLRAGRVAGGLVWRLVKLIAVLLSLVIVAIVVLGAVTTQRGWPQVNGTLAVAGLEAPVTVVRDAYGIIQITADTQRDLFIAQGYVHAQERMWQMELSRRIGAGRLSELFGKSQVDTDRYIRTLGWRVAAQRDLDAMSLQTKAILQAYADGVNAWITEHQGRLSTPFVVSGVLSGRYNIGGYELEPWTPLDTATWQKVQAWSLGGNVDSEIFRLLADARLGDPAKTNELFPAYDPTAPIITPSAAMGDGGGYVAPPPPGDQLGSVGGSTANALMPELSEAHATALAALGNRASGIASLAGLGGGGGGGLVGDHGVGSNNWVVAGDRTASGKPILANDPHLGFGMPSVWIMNGLHCRNVGTVCPWNVVGVTFPGAPAVVLGHNNRIAWGATNLNPDTQDLFLETVDPANDKNYMYQGASLPFEVRQEVIRVAGGADVVVDVRSTRHGVVLSDVDERLADGPVLAMRWTTTAEVDLAIETFFELDLATNFDEFRAAFDGYGSPSQNFIYADVDGNVGYVLPGLIPVRDKAAVTGGCPIEDASCFIRWATGERVRDGASGTAEWTGYVPREELPWQLNPASGEVVSANNAPVDNAYGHWIGNEYDPGYRAARISQLLAEHDDRTLTTEHMRQIQMDTYLLRADSVIPALVALVPTPGSEDGRALGSAITRWDRKCDAGSAGCAAYVAVELALMRAIFDDELGPIAREYVGSTMSWEALIDVLGNRASAWWQLSGSTGPSPDAADVVSTAIDQTAAALRAAYGEPAGWTWGRLHQVQFTESTLGSSGIPPLEWYFNSASRAVGGADGAIQNNYYRVQRAYGDPSDPSFVPPSNVEVFGVTNGPSYRFTIDMNDLDGARIVITTGQSGNPGDPHYGDLIPLWADGGTIPLPFSAGNVQASAAQTLTLTPP